MKNVGKVANVCLSCFMIETSRYDSPRTNQGPLRRPSAVDVALIGSVYRRDRRKSMCGVTGHGGHRDPTHGKIREGSCLPRYCYTRLKWIDGASRSPSSHT